MCTETQEEKLTHIFLCPCFNKVKRNFQVWLSLKLLSKRTGIVTDPENIQTRLVTDPCKIETPLISSCESRNDLQVSRKQALTAWFRS